MPFTSDPCSDIAYHCVVVPFRVLACVDDLGDPLPPPRLGGKLTLANPSGLKVTDGNDGLFLPGAAIQQWNGANETVTLQGVTPVYGWDTVTHDGCDYWAVRTCALPANVDTDYDPSDPASVNRGLDIGGTSYKLELDVNGVTCTFEFVIDAAVDYTPSEIDGCIPITALSDVPGPPLGSDSFTTAVCDAVASCTTGGGVDTFVTITDNGDGTITLTPAGGGTGVIIATGPHPTSGGNTSVLVDNNDGTYTHDDGTGTTVTISTGAGGDWCTDAQALPDIPDGVDISSALVIGADNECYAVPASDVCRIDGPQGLTGQQSGAFIDGCTIEPMPASGDPEDIYPAAGFLEGWRQLYSGGMTGTETWIVLNDTNGAPQWHQQA